MARGIGSGFDLTEAEDLVDLNDIFEPVRIMGAGLDLPCAEELDLPLNMGSGSFFDESLSFLIGSGSFFLPFLLLALDDVLFFEMLLNVRGTRGPALAFDLTKLPLLCLITDWWFTGGIMR
jgi:hypothetical protein